MINKYKMCAMHTTKKEYSSKEKKRGRNMKMNRKKAGINSKTSKQTNKRKKRIKKFTS